MKRENGSVDSAEELFDKANELSSRGQFEEVLRGYESALAALREPEDRFGVLLGVAGCLAKLGRFEEARHRLREAAGFLSVDDDNHVHVEFAEAGILTAEGEREKALKILDGVASSKPRVLRAVRGEELYTEVEARRGFLLAELHRYKEARPILEKALTRGFDDASLPYYLGMTYFSLDEFDGAKKYISEALSKGVSGAWQFQSHTHLGAIYFREGAYAKAKLEYEHAEALTSVVGATSEVKNKLYKWLSLICKELGEGEEAERYKGLAAQP